MQVSELLTEHSNNPFQDSFQHPREGRETRRNSAYHEYITSILMDTSGNTYIHVAKQQLRNSSSTLPRCMAECTERSIDLSTSNTSKHRLLRISPLRAPPLSSLLLSLPLLFFHFFFSSFSTWLHFFFYLSFLSPRVCFGSSFCATFSSFFPPSPPLFLFLCLFSLFFPFSTSTSSIIFLSSSLSAH